MIVTKAGGLFVATLVVVGSFLPWATSDAGETVWGMESLGLPALIGGLTLAVLFAFARRATIIAAVVVGLVVTGIGAAGLADLWPTLSEIGSRVGVGLPMVLGGGIAVLLVVMVGVLRDRLAGTARP